jgi:hypothetical protein
MRFLAVLGLLCFWISSFGQAVTVPPPPIAFADWKAEEVTDDFTEYSLKFPSAMVTAYPENNEVPTRIFIPEGKKGPFPTVVVLHYWGATDLRPERELATELCRRGIAAAVMTLPYHLERTPAGQRSGAMAIQGSIQGLKDMSTQCVLDVRRLIDFLDTREEIDPVKIGITGTSLGALVTALSYALDTRISSATFVLGGVDFAQIMWNSSRVVLQRDALRRQGYTEGRLRNELVDVEPLTYLGKRTLGPSLVVGAKFDTVVPNGATDELIAVLPNPKVLWLDTGHYGGIFVQRRLMREVAAFFDSVFHEKPYTAPRKLYAPTVRVGLKADTPNGFDVALGLDLFQFDSKGETFVTLLVTPRGPDIFAGRKITPVLAAGVFFNTRNIGVGIFWSTVL